VTRRDDADRPKAAGARRRARVRPTVAPVQAGDPTGPEATDAGLSELFSRFAHDVILVFDEQLAVVDCNERALEIYGYSREELLGLTLADLRAGDQEISVEARMRQVRLSGGCVFESSNRRKDGTTFPVETSVQCVETSGGLVYHAIIRDITERKLVEEELRRSERRLRSAEAMAHIGHWTEDLRTGAVDWSDEMYRMLGLDAATFVPSFEALRERVHPQDRVVLDTVRQKLARDDAAESLYRIVRPHGEERTWATRAHAVRDAAGEVIVLFGVNQDITEQVEVENALRESEERYRSLFDSMLEGFAYCHMLHDDAGRATDWVYLAVNHSFERLTGLTGVVGKRVLEVLPSIRDDSPELFEAYDRVATTGRPEELEFDFKTLGMWLSISVFSPAADHFVAIFEDITDRRRAETELHENRALLQGIVDGTPDSVFAKDLDGKYLLMNSAGARLVGKEPSQIIGADDTQLFSPAEAAALREGDRLLIAGGTPETQEEHLTNARGEARTFLATKAPLFDEHGRPRGLVGIGHDITDRIKAEDDLRRTAEQLRRALEGSVLAMSRIVELRDPYTAGHERHVAELATAIAERMGMNGNELLGLRLGALIHDIGKIAVPAEILSKPGRLSETEFMLITGHSRAGCEILGAIEFGRPVAEMVLQHHERIDGSGYPDHLKGDQLLLEARILAVADVVEAMASHRPYRPALGIDVALAEIRANAGVKYDANVAAACIGVIEEQGFTFSP
jgi:PAS domain S-box-containing protein/putative nucleotidyltransferase with HDIG domain